MSTYHKRHSSDLRFCSCRMCRSGLHTKSEGEMVQIARRASRRKIKLLCRKAISNPDIEIPTRFGVDYTD